MAWIGVYGPDMQEIRSVAKEFDLHRSPSRTRHHGPPARKTRAAPNDPLHRLAAGLPVVAGLENDIDEIEDQLFIGDPAVCRRIYELSREVTEFQRATHSVLAGYPLAIALMVATSVTLHLIFKRRGWL